jgi:hypothetical protein
MDITALPAFLLNNGPWGAVVLYLLYDRHSLIARLDRCQDAYNANLVKIVEEVTEAVTSSTDAMRAATSAQVRLTDSQSVIGEGLKLVQLALSTLEKDVARLDRETGA